MRTTICGRDNDRNVRKINIKTNPNLHICIERKIVHMLKKNDKYSVLEIYHYICIKRERGERKSFIL